ncbi:hypothetical protein N9342_00040 [Candidatus Marinimicrobia bacterium]|nr:hypothetical protein [Candidatus Neomarinimicrobiota bacterium]
MFYLLTLNKSAGFIVTLSFFSILAKFSNLDDLGVILILLQLIVTFTLILSLGIPFSANKILSENRNLINEFLIKGLRILFMTSLIILPIIYLLLSKIYSLNLIEILLFCLIIILNCFLFYVAQILQSIKYTNLSFLLNYYGMRGVALQSLFTLGLLILLYFKVDFTIINILKIIVFSIIVQSIIGLVILKKIKKNNIKKNENLTSKDMINIGTSIGVNRFIKSLLMPLSFTMIVYIYGQEISAIYQSNLRILITCTAFFSSVFLPTKIPDINSIFENNKKRFVNLFLQIIKITFLINVIGMLFYYLFYENLITLIFSKDFIIKNSEIINLICIAVLLNILGNTSVFLNYSNNANENSKLNLLGIFIGILFLGIVNNFKIIISIEMILFSIFLLPHIISLIKMIRIIYD